MSGQKPVFSTGTDLSAAKFGMIMLHGRGSDPHDMQSIIPMLELRNTHVLIPEGPYEIMPRRFAWYRHFWNENLFLNIQEMDHSFSIIDDCVQSLEKGGLETENIVIFGHSQGGNMALEYFVRTQKKFKAVIGLRSCLIGKTTMERDLPPKVPNTTVVLCSGRKDPFIPNKKVDQTKDLLTKLGANVMKKQYEAAHGVSRPELIDLRKLFDSDFTTELA